MLTMTLEHHVEQLGQHERRQKQKPEWDMLISARTNTSVHPSSLVLKKATLPTVSELCRVGFVKTHVCADLVGFTLECTWLSEETMHYFQIPTGVAAWPFRQTEICTV